MKTKLVFCTVVFLLLGLLCGCGQQTVHIKNQGDKDVTQSVPDADNAEAEARNAALYTEYLLNGGYADMLYNYDDPDADYDAQAVLADVNADSVRELLMHITDRSSGGVRGFSSVTVLLGMQDGEVVRLGFADYGGGSGGGDYLFIKYDTAAKEHVLEYEEYVRDGMFFSTYALHYFDVSQLDTQEKEYGLVGAGDVVYKTAHTLRCNTYSTEGAYADEAARVLAESDLCTEENGLVTAYTYDDNYISEAQYDAIRGQYVEPTDPAYQMKPVTLDNPIPTD